MRGWEPRCEGLVPAGDTLGYRITQLRERAGMTPKQFAEATGLNVRQVQRFAFGQKSTRSDEPGIRTIAGKFGVNPTWLGAGSACPARMWPEWWKPPQ
jgi:transcriptional regulator with XRE-family HTH domain